MGSLAVGHFPIGIAISPDGKRDYVANNLEGTLSIIDLKRVAMLGTIVADAYPTGVAITPDGSELYVPSNKTTRDRDLHGDRTYHRLRCRGTHADGVRSSSVRAPARGEIALVRSASRSAP